LGRKKRRQGKSWRSPDPCEQDLVDFLRSFGCRISTSGLLDNKYKIDALVESLPGREAGQPPIGMQISHQHKDRDKTDTFFKMAALATDGPLFYAKLDLTWGQHATREMALSALAILQQLWDEWPKVKDRRRKAFIRPDGSWNWLEVG